MSSVNRPARLNRSLLAMLGIELLAAGGFAVATHFGTMNLLKPAAALVPGTAQPTTVALYIAAAVAVVLGLLCLRWLFAQVARKPKTRTWRFEQDVECGRTELAASAAIEPFLAEVSSYDGVQTANATLAGTHAEPTVALIVSVEQDGDPTMIRRQLHTEGLPRLRQALDLTDLQATIEFRFSTKTAARIR